jgi:NAD(P)-dependent dehydrogenase (short-subunit alcohol dehydrogenase family)
MKKNALITGGNSGIGYATAKILSEHGYAVTISGRNKAAVETAASQLGTEAIIADMSSLQDIKGLAAHFSKPGLDVLVNNAAIAKFQPVGAITSEDFDEILHTNVRGPLLLLQGLLPALEKRRGCVTTVSSVIVNKGVPNACLYAASKGAVDAYTRTLAKELAPKGIRVNAVAPGAIDTPILNKTGLSPEQLQALKKIQENNIPLSRYGQPEEVAQVIVAMIESSYVTGAIWRVDGGVTA